MKTFNATISQAILIILVGFGGFSCSDKDEPTFDQRDMVVGSYRYTAKVHDQSGEQFINGTLSVAKRDNTLLTVVIDGQQMIGSKVSGDATGTLFDLEPVVLSDQQGDAYRLHGIGRYQHQGVTYHAFYDDQIRALSLTLATDYVNNTYDQYNTLVEFEAHR